MRRMTWQALHCLPGPTLRCPSGTFGATGGAAACQACPAGAFASVPGLEVCTSCPAGSFAEGTGNTECMSCPMGEAWSAPRRRLFAHSVPVHLHLLLLLLTPSDCLLIQSPYTFAPRQPPPSTPSNNHLHCKPSFIYDKVHEAEKLSGPFIFCPKFQLMILDCKDAT